MNGLSITLPPPERWLRYPITAVLADERNAHRHANTPGREIAFLALELANRQYLVLTVRCLDVETSAGAVEFCLPQVSIEEQLPVLHKWPAGPALEWLHLQDLESVLVGATIESFEPMREEVPVWPLLKTPEGFRKGEETVVSTETAILLKLSSGLSVRVQASDLPTTFDIAVEEARAETKS